VNKAIVVGATGGTGASITEDLIKRGIHTIALGRSRQKLEQLAARVGYSYVSLGKQVVARNRPDCRDTVRKRYHLNDSRVARAIMNNVFDEIY
jgi:short-subunit dehydrogenase